jgi:hypothetical protein
VYATAASGAATPANPATDPGKAIVIDQNYMGGAARSLIPSRFNDPATSGLTWTIKAGENVLDLNLSD